MTVLRTGQRAWYIPGVGVRVSRRGVISSTWPLDWTVPGVTAPTILFQFKGAPDQASMLTNLGSGAPSYNGVALAPASLPASDVDRGAVFRGAIDFNTGDGIATNYPLVGTGSYYYVKNQRLVSDYNGTVTTSQRTGYPNNPRVYLSHYFVTARLIWGSGSSTHIDNSWQAQGSLGLSPGKAYKNGVLVNGALNTSWSSVSVMFGGAVVGSSWTGGNWFCCDVPIFAWWATTISDAAMALWEAAVLERLEL